MLNKITSLIKTIYGRTYNTSAQSPVTVGILVLFLVMSQSGILTYSAYALEVPDASSIINDVQQKTQDTAQQAQDAADQAAQEAQDILNPPSDNSDTGSDTGTSDTTTQTDTTPPADDTSGSSSDQTQDTTADSTGSESTGSGETTTSGDGDTTSDTGSDTTSDTGSDTGTSDTTTQTDTTPPADDTSGSSSDQTQDTTADSTGSESTGEQTDNASDNTSQEQTDSTQSNDTNGNTDEASDASSGGNSSGSGDSAGDNFVEGSNLDTASSTPSSTPGDVIKDSHIDTGDADAVVGVGNNVNNNSVDVGDTGAGGAGGGNTNATSTCESVDACGDGSSVDIADTGEDSNNASSAEINEDVTVSNDNDADIQNDLGGEANSGDNSMEAEGDGSAIKHSSIDTGNASAAAGVGNYANTNQVYTGGSGAEYPWMRTTVINEDTDIDSVNTSELDVNRSYSVINENDLNLVNDLDLIANSGGNLMSADYKVSDGSILTGHASALANILNFANVNWVNSSVLPYVRNMGGGNGDIDLMGLLSGNFGLDTVQKFFIGNKNTGEGSVNSAELNYNEQLSVKNNNNGSIINNVLVKATSGLNSLLSNYKVKDSSIQTGDVYAAANIFNFLNANFTNAQFVYSIINIFGDYSGTLFLPGEKQLFGSPTGGDIPTIVKNKGLGDDSINESLVVLNDETEINNDNTANVNNQVDASADSGNNKFIAGSKAKRNSVVTGGTQALSNVVNLVNKNVIGGTWFLGLFNFFGEWYGGLYNEPSNALVDGSSNSFVISSDGYGSSTGDDKSCDTCSGATAANIDTGEDSENHTTLRVTKRTDIDNNNIANIDNNVTVIGNSGGNEVRSGYKAYDNKIVSGNAQAATNITNFANLNFLDTKIVVTVFNVFGSFMGDIAFGKVDLGITYGSPVSSVAVGDTVSYAIDYTNSGDGRAKNTVVTATYDPSQVSVSNSGGGTDDGNGKITWNANETPPGGTTHFTYSVNVKNDATGSSIDSTATVDDPAESDDTKGDNSATYSIALIDDSSDGSSSDPGDSGDTGGSGSGGGSDLVSGDTGGGAGGGVGGPVYGGTPHLVVTKVTRDGSGPYYSGETIYFTVEVSNDGQGAAFDVKLYDQLINDSGDILFENTWDLDLIYKNQKAVVEYTLTVPSDVVDGVYTNSSMADGFDDWHELVVSNEASVSVTLLREQNDSNQGSGGIELASADTNEAQDNSGGSELITDESAAVSDETGTNEQPFVLGASFVNNVSASDDAGDIDDESLVLAGSGDAEVLGATEDSGTVQLIEWKWIGLLALFLLLLFLLFAWRRGRGQDDLPIDY